MTERSLSMSFRLFTSTISFTMHQNVKDSPTPSVNNNGSAYG